MPDIIHLLPDSVANQIAAGEVIQRPASVIKELVENSLDAGATHIQVLVENAGKSLIQVIDNGKGMSDTDARLSFERHATSKITQATDLFALRTMGFRGEALASIAAVAQVELRTRRPEDELGTRLLIEGSRTLSQEPASCAPGANFSVKNLFFNIPARRKFLKSNQTELTNITAEMERIALAHPSIAFTLRSEGNVMMELPAGNFKQRILSLFGSKMGTQLVRVETATSLAEIQGYTGTPASARRKNTRQFLFVNGRFMRHPYFAKAILTAYDRLIPDGHQVPFFIDFKVDPARIDVNIHPTKTEIKFEDDAAIFQILLAAVREALGKAGAVPAIDFDTEARPDIPIYNDGAGREYVAPPKIHFNEGYNPFAAPGGGNNAESGAARQESPEGFVFSRMGSARPAADGWQEAYSGLESFSGGNAGYDGLSAPTGEDGTDSGADDTAWAKGTESTQLFHGLPPEERNGWGSSPATLLQYRGQYIVTPTGNGLAVVDQHRAHIRILYERYLRQAENRKAPSQRLLFPEMLSLSPAESTALEGMLPQLTAMGFDISPLGAGSYAVNAAPSGAEGLSPTRLVTSIVEEAAGDGARVEDIDPAAALNRRVALALAKKVAMPVGQYLSPDEMRQLLDDLHRCDTPALTPDGRPTLVVLPQETIERMF